MKHSEKMDCMAVTAIRMLAVDTVQKADSGHPGLPLGMADCAYVLWMRYLRLYGKDPQWPNRDRFILSAGHGSALLYVLLHLSGFDLDLEDLKMFRQWGSKTPGHPELGITPGVETTTGPLGQGFANGVGIALSSRILAGKFNTPDFSPIDYRVFGIVSDGDLMEGISSEAASIAGHLGLGNLIYLYDNNSISIEGSTDLTFTEDVSVRFDAYGWQTISIDGHNHEEISGAICEGIRDRSRPTLILAKTHIGYGSPKQDNASCHGAPLGEEDVRKTRENLNWPQEAFDLPEEIYSHFKTRSLALGNEYEEWKKGFVEWRSKHPDLAQEWDRMSQKQMPDDLEEQLLDAVPEKPMASRAMSGKILQRAAKLYPGLVGGSADLAPSTQSLIEGSSSVSKKDFCGKNLHFGVREHGMGAILNGMALSHGIIPYGATFFVFSDYMRPAIRMAALMKLQVIYIFTHDSIFVGEDGPTHQPVEHLTALRIIPDLITLRPADRFEAAAAWALALRRTEGPTALVLTRQTLQVLERSPLDKKLFAHGGYVLNEASARLSLVLIGSGSEVAICQEVKKQLEKKDFGIRIASMPSFDLFRKQPSEYRRSVLPAGIPFAVVEAGLDFGWGDLSFAPRLVVGINRFGSSAPFGTLAEKFGFTGEKATAVIREWIQSGFKEK